VTVAVADVLLALAVIVELPLPDAGVVTVKVAVVAPAATVTVAGTVAVELDASLTMVPVPPAALARVTVPVGLTPSRTDDGEIVRLETAGPVAMNAPETVVEPVVAETATFALLPTVAGVAVNVAVVAPARTVTVAGIVAVPVVTARATGKPPVGAAEPIVTVPVVGVPPATEVGLNAKPVTTGSVTVKVAELVPPLPVAVITEEPFAISVVTVKVAEVAAAGIVTVAGTVATEVVPDVSAIERPPVGAGAEMVTVPVEGAGPTTDVGLSVNVVTAPGLTVTVVVTVEMPVVALIVAVVAVPTAVVVAVKVAVVAPAGTVTEPGTTTAGLLEDSVTVVPPEAALPVKVTVPVVIPPPSSEDGEKDTASTIAGKMPSANLSVTPPALAVRLAVILLETTCAVTAKVAEVAPAGTTTVAGTVTCATSEPSATLKPPVGAAALKVTVPVIVPPPYAGLGTTVKPVRVVALAVRLEG
jgi:hypothetical protein